MRLLVSAVLVLWTRFLAAQNVVELTSETFYPFLKATPGLAVVDFYAPWCGHCLTLSPVLDKVASKLSKLGAQARFAKLDGSQLQAETIIADEKIDGYPTVLLYRFGRRIGEYHGNRTEADIMQYVHTKASNTLTIVQDEMEIVPFISALDRTDTFHEGILAVVIGAFPPEHQGLKSKEADVLTRIMDRYDHAKFFATEAPQLLSDFKVQTPSLVVFSADDRDVFHTIPLAPETSEDDVIHQLLLLSLPLSLTYSTETQPLLSALPVAAHALAFYDSTSGSDDAFLDAVAGVMPHFKGRVIMVEVGTEEYSLLHHFGLEFAADLPQLILVDAQLEAQHGVARKYSFVDFLATYHENERQKEKRKQQQSEAEEERVVSADQADAAGASAEAAALEGKDNYEAPFGYQKHQQQQQPYTLSLRYPTNQKHAQTADIIDSSVDYDEKLYYNDHLIRQFFTTFLEDFGAQSLDSQSRLDIERLNNAAATTGSMRTVMVENIASSQFVDKVMEDVTVDTLVYFHAPWCIHCKAVEALVSDLAVHFFGTPLDEIAAAQARDQTKLRFYRMDASENEVSVHQTQVRLHALPALYFFPAFHKHEPVVFDGDRSLASLVEFVDQHRSGSDDVVEAKPKDVDMLRSLHPAERVTHPTVFERRIATVDN